MRPFLSLAFLTLASCCNAEPPKPCAPKESLRLTQHDADDVVVGLYADEVKQRFGDPFAVITTAGTERWFYDAERDGGLDFVLVVEVNNGRVVGIVAR